MMQTMTAEQFGKAQADVELSEKFLTWEQAYNAHRSSPKESTEENNALWAMITLARFWEEAREAYKLSLRGSAEEMRALEKMAELSKTWEQATETYDLASNVGNGYDQARKIALLKKIEFVSTWNNAKNLLAMVLPDSEEAQIIITKMIGLSANLAEITYTFRASLPGSREETLARKMMLVLIVEEI
jgi:hypothetical protein